MVQGPWILPYVWSCCPRTTSAESAQDVRNQSGPFHDRPRLLDPEVVGLLGCKVVLAILGGILYVGCPQFGYRRIDFEAVRK